MTTLTDRLRALAQVEPQGHTGCVQLWLDAADEIDRQQKTLADAARPEASPYWVPRSWHEAMTNDDFSYWRSLAEARASTIAEQSELIDRLNKKCSALALLQYGESSASPSSKTESKWVKPNDLHVHSPDCRASGCIEVVERRAVETTAGYRIIRDRAGTGWAYAFGTEYPHEGFATFEAAETAAQAAARNALVFFNMGDSPPTRCIEPRCSNVRVADEPLCQRHLDAFNALPEKSSGHPVVACIYRDGCRKFPACMTEARCCGSDASIPETR